MNERNKELYLKSLDEHSEFCYQRFAELIRLDERDKCAMLCDNEANQSSSDHEAGGMYWCADAIRARGGK